MLALQGHAERIIVVERDRFPAQPDVRPGVPQARHAHLLLEGGHRALEALLPNIREELRTAGAVNFAMSGELRWRTAAGLMAEHDSSLTITSCTRALLDHVVRARVYAGAEIRQVDGEQVRILGGSQLDVLEGWEAIGLLGTRKRLTGARIRARGGGATPVREVNAELIVDASGRSSSLTRWLRELGCPPTPEVRVDAGVSYASRLFYRPPVDHGFSALYLQTAPGYPQTGALLPVEGHRWIVSLGAMRGSETEPGERGFNQLLSQLRDPILRETLRNAEPASEVRGFRPGPSVRRYFERSAPEGLVVLSDANASFNPVYGQGMSVLIRGALAMRSALRRYGGIGIPAARAAQKGIAAETVDSWLMSASEDMRFPATIGGQSGAFTQVQHRFLDRVLSRATTDPLVAAAFQEVMSLVSPPRSLFRPQILGRVLLGSGGQ
ncbi:NAD(P)/FAD-dependent oxidoreductase [Nocardia sp. NPDC003963]